MFYSQSENHLNWFHLYLRQLYPFLERIMMDATLLPSACRLYAQYFDWSHLLVADVIRTFVVLCREFYSDFILYSISIDWLYFWSRMLSTVYWLIVLFGRGFYPDFVVYVVCSTPTLCTVFDCLYLLVTDFIRTLFDLCREFYSDFFGQSFVAAILICALNVRAKCKDCVWMWIHTVNPFILGFALNLRALCIRC